MKYSRDILVRVIIKKDGRKAAYVSQRRSKTDFPLIAVAAAKKDDMWYISVGARPSKAALVTRPVQTGCELSAQAEGSSQHVLIWRQPAGQRGLPEVSDGNLCEKAHGAVKWGGGIA